MRPGLYTLFAVASLLAPSIGLAAGPVSVQTNCVEEILVQGRDHPHGLCFLPDGRRLYTEQYTGRIRMIVSGHIAATVCGTVDNVDTVYVELGLQGITVDPRWPNFPYVYVCYNQLGPREVIARFTASGD